MGSAFFVDSTNGKPEPRKMELRTTGNLEVDGLKNTSCSKRRNRSGGGFASLIGLFYERDLGKKSAYYLTISTVASLA